MIQLYRPVMKLPSPFQLAKRDASGNSFNLLTQLFGENLVDFYAQMGMKGHNGLDFMVAYVDCFAAHDGEVFKILDQNNSSPTAGYGVYIRHAEGWHTLYFHMNSVAVKVGDKVKAGYFIGITGNTGRYTVGPHLHFGLYPANPDINNGFGGAIDPLKYFSTEEITGIINQSKQNKMILTIQQGDLYITDLVNKFSWSIPNPEALEGVKKHFSLIGNPLVEPVYQDLTGFYVIHGGDIKSIREFFNINKNMTNHF